LRQRNDPSPWSVDAERMARHTASRELAAHMTMAELIAECPAAAAVLSRQGMACVGCGMAKFETVSDAAQAYGMDPAELLAQIAGTRPSTARRTSSARPGRRAQRRL
jgi:hybrid cluster-associated redox disulfide protein